MGFRFWRFDLQLSLGDQPGLVNYMVGLVGGTAPHSTHVVHLPARSQGWHWMFYSCNGFHEPEVRGPAAGKKMQGALHCAALRCAALFSKQMAAYSSMPLHAKVALKRRIFKTLNHR